MTKRTIKLRSVNHIVKLAVKGEDGRDWYTFAAAQIKIAAQMIGVPFERFCDIMSVLSPRVSVKRNIRFALRYLKDGTFAHDVMTPIRASVNHYEITGEIRGPKTSAFAAALKGDENAIVLDVWMAVAFGVDQALFSRKPIHVEACKRIKRAAKILGWTPCQVQAAVWVATVRRAGRTPSVMELVVPTLFGNFLIEAA